MSERRHPVAIVTGAASGLGYQASLALARANFHVFATVRRIERAAQLEAALIGAGGAYTLRQLDVTDHGAIEATTTEARATHGQIDVLVNNAGYKLEGFVEETTLPEIRDQLETNFFGLVAMTKAVIPGMRAQRSGCIINISCAAGHVGFPGGATYAASKFAVEGFSESLRHELRPYGVHVSVIVAGTQPTEFYDRNLRISAAAHHESRPNYRMMRKISFSHDLSVRTALNSPSDVGNAVALTAQAASPRFHRFVGADGLMPVLAKRILPFCAWEALVSRSMRTRKS